MMTRLRQSDSQNVYMMGQKTRSYRGQSGRLSHSSSTNSQKRFALSKSRKSVGQILAKGLKGGNKGLASLSEQRLIIGQMQTRKAELDQKIKSNEIEL